MLPVNCCCVGVMLGLTLAKGVIYLTFLLSLGLIYLNSSPFHFLSSIFSYSSPGTNFAPTAISHPSSRRFLQPSDKNHDPYSSYYPAPVDEPFIRSHRCPNSIDHPSRAMPHVAMYDQLFRDMLEVYDGNNRLHQKQTFMGTRMGQFPFDLQVITEVLFPCAYHL